MRGVLQTIGNDATVEVLEWAKLMDAEGIMVFENVETMCWVFLRKDLECKDVSFERVKQSQQTRDELLQWAKQTVQK